ncbi:hypothetical protein RNZ50_18445 [Paracoccaceae bacterium Fryx2]|nr:hypothetical protein [Paracoccaceae bacterium Fryx2]
MTNGIIKGAGIVALVLVAGCSDGLRPYDGNPNTVIATAYDTGRDGGRLTNGGAAIAYDPDGCQNWIMDDGVEGYSTPRYDPKSGLPVCNNRYPPGTVLKNYQTQSPGINDYVPRPGYRTVVVQR